MSQHQGDQYISTPEGETGEWINWHGFPIQVGPGHGPAFLNDIQMRQHNRQAIIGIITGSPGVGKTFFGLTLAQIFDKHFKIRDLPPPDPAEDDSQVCFDTEHLLHLVGDSSPLRRGQVLIIDEAQFIAGSRSWYDRMQKDLMNQLAGVRRLGLQIWIIALHRDMLDVIIRRHILNYHIHVDSPGCAVAYRTYTPKFESEVRYDRIQDVMLPLPWEDLCPNPDCLGCKFLNAGCKVPRTVYERRKAEFLGRKAGVSANVAKQALAKANAKAVVTDAQLISKLYELRNELTFKKSGYVDPISIKLVLEREFPTKFSGNRYIKLGRELQLSHPDIASPEERR